ncbi:MAG: hypothetical protein H6649_12820 [Caldilineae bacterium]|nr:hypothetical protein [Caldilineae bacterium]
MGDWQLHARGGAIGPGRVSRRWRRVSCWEPLDRRLNQDRFRVIVLGLILATGVLLL